MATASCVPGLRSTLCSACAATSSARRKMKQHKETKTRKAADRISSTAASMMFCTDAAVPALAKMVLASLLKAMEELVLLPCASHAAATERRAKGVAEEAHHNIRT